LLLAVDLAWLTLARTVNVICAPHEVCCAEIFPAEGIIKGFHVGSSN